jgi:3-deoxy-D-manno-octulosonic-acid transferase
VRHLYVLLTRLLIPVLLVIEGWRELRHPASRGRLRQRLGRIERTVRPGCVWIHAVSVGEVQAAAALVREIERRVPGVDIVVTTVTPTGSQRARSLFGDRVLHAYLPYDAPGAVRRFVHRLQPRIAVMLETELWPTLYRELRRRDVPVVIASARLTERSVARYRKFATLIAETLSGDVVIGAQTHADADRFRALGAPAARVSVTGNVKFDLEIPQSAIDAGQEARRAWGGQRRVWTAGSTHDGEELAALDAHAALRARHADALLILVPRHPPRFESVRALLDTRGVRYAARSRRESVTADCEVLLVDTLGELQAFYAASDAAFVGGSLVPIGGHSLLEPAVLGLPVVSGPHTQNAPDVAALLQQAGALTIVEDAGGLASAITAALDDPNTARAAGARGRDAVAANRGAVSRVADLVEQRLRASDEPRASRSAASEAY